MFSPPFVKLGISVGNWTSRQKHAQLHTEVGYTMKLELALLLFAVGVTTILAQDGYEEDDFDDSLCYFDPKHPFYLNSKTGSICCRGKTLNMPKLIPDASGQCAISTTTKPDETLDSNALWCSYACQLKKLGMIDATDKVVPDAFLNHLAKGVSQKTKENLKLIMTNHLKCFAPAKNNNNPCYTALGFHKCWNDALEFLCTHGMPKNNDFSTVKNAPPKKLEDYTGLVPNSCTFADGKRIMPACCHNRPLPWLIPEIVRAPMDSTKLKTCLANFNRVHNSSSSMECVATCALQTLGVVDDAMELDPVKFEALVTKYFSKVKASAWMQFLGPTFLFYDEYQTDQTNGWQETLSDSQRVCRFHNAVLSLHLNKIEEYCSFTPAELKEAFGNKKK